MGFLMESRWSRTLAVVVVAWLAMGFVCPSLLFWVFDARGGRSGSRWLRWHGVEVELECRSDMACGFC